MSIIVNVTISYIAIYTVIFVVTFCLIARSNLDDGVGICSKQFLYELRLTFTKRATLAGFSVLHFVDVGFDYGVMMGWYFEQNEFREIISYNGSLLLFVIALHLVSKITSSVYIYGVTRSILPTIMQLFDLEIYYEMYFDQNATNMDIKIEQLYRSFAVLQSFPICIIQAYLLIAYELVDAGQMLDYSDFIYISLTFVSLSTSLLFILSLQIIHDSSFMNMADKYMSCGMHKWLIRVLFRTFELLSRVLLLSYIWILYGILAVIVVLCAEWLFQLYNHYKKERYDSSSEHSIRMWRKQNKFFLWPLVMDELISFWNFDWKLPASNPPKQRSMDVVDIVQCWTLASLVYGNKKIRKSMRERPPCDCRKPMDEYWGSGLEPVDARQLNQHLELQTVRKRTLTGTATGTRSRSVSSNVRGGQRTLSVASNQSAYEDNKGSGYDLKIRAATAPVCSSCNTPVAITSHYFRCPTFLQSQIEDIVLNEKVTKHGKYLCIHCGYARMTYLPSLFVFSRNIFCWFYIVLLSILSVLNVDCGVLCINDGYLNNFYHKTAYKSLVFLVGISCHILSPMFFILILTTKQMKLREIEAKAVSGKVVRYANKLNWSKVYELIRHEECDVNEVDRTGRSALIYAAMSHNFQVIRDLQQYGANMDHVDINAMGIRHYISGFKQTNNDDIQDRLSVDYGDLQLTGPTRAAKNGSSQDLYLCIEIGCNLNQMDGYGHTPLLIACKERETEIIKILIEQSNKYHSVDINKADADGRSAIIIVTQYGYDDLLYILLYEANDIDMDHRDKEGKTAFEHAITCNQKKCAKLIFNYKKEKELETQLTQINTHINEEDSLNNIMLPKDIQEIEAEPDIDDDVNGDYIEHPVGMLDTPMSDAGTGFSPIKLHESDSIDLRIYRKMTVEKMHQKQNDNDDDDDSLKKQQTISIVVTNVDAIKDH